MGFDIKCIIDILLCPANYFCPLCRTVVHPTEALQTQCTHIYCKPCLSHVANGSRKCPFDGSLVTESDSKPLMESDKVLAEKMGKIRVRCPFVKSGCTWEGSFAECKAHWAGCSFGNTPIECYGCGVMHLHKQASEHDLYCPGGFVALHGGVNAVGLSAKTAQTSTSYQQVSGSVQPLVIAPVAAQTQEQWWYQQPYQQNQQQLVPVQVQNHPSAQAQASPQPHTQLVPPIPHPPVQMHCPPQASQVRVQPQMHPPPQNQTPPLPQMHPGNHSYGQVPPLQPYHSRLRPYVLPPPPPLSQTSGSTMLEDKQDNVEKGSSCAKSSEVGRDADKIYGKESSMLNNPDMKHKGLEIRDAGSSELVLGGMSSADCYKRSLYYASKYRNEGSSGAATLRDYYDKGLHWQSYKDEPSFGLREPKRKLIDRECIDPYSDATRRPPYHSSGYKVNSPPGQNSDATPRPSFAVSSSYSRFLSHRSDRMGNFGPGPEVGSHHTNFGTDREYLGISAHGFGEGFRSFHQSSDPVHDDRFPPSFDHLQRDSITGPRSINDHMGPSILNNRNMRGTIGSSRPGHLLREGFAEPDTLSGRDHTTELPTGSFHGMRNNYPVQGLPNALRRPESLGLSRRPTSTGWCRICQVECETIEELEIHSQSQEHQNMAMDIVKTIKKQNEKKHRTSMGHYSRS